jgi:hypothetical protein
MLTPAESLLAMAKMIEDIDQSLSRGETEMLGRGMLCSRWPEPGTLNLGAACWCMAL